jgi:hypothetical protein
MSGVLDKLGIQARPDDQRRGWAANTWANCVNGPTWYRRCGRGATVACFARLLGEAALLWSRHYLASLRHNATEKLHRWTWSCDARAQVVERVLLITWLQYSLRHSVVPKHSAQFNRRKAFSSLRRLQHQTPEAQWFPLYFVQDITTALFVRGRFLRTNRGRHTAALAFVHAWRPF